MKLLSGHVLRDHVIIGGLAALVLLPFFGGWGSFAFWVANVLIDLDHYMRFVYYTGFKVFGIGSMLQYHDQIFERRKHPEFLSVEIFHTAEFLILLGALAIWAVPSLLPIFWGFVFHVVVDFIHLTRFRMLKNRSNSFVEYFIRRKNMLARGKNPDYVFQTALKALNLPSIF